MATLPTSISLTSSTTTNAQQKLNLAALRDFSDDLSKGQSYAAEATVASAATADIGAANSFFVQITGTTTITSFGANYSGARFIRFAGALTLTHGASLILPGAANRVTAAGDTALVVPTGNPGAGWRVVNYQRGDGVVAVSGARAYVEPSSVSYAASLTIDASKSNIFYVGALTGNVTTLTLSNPVDGHSMSVRFVQDGTGGRTVAAPSGAKISGSPDTGANRVSYLNLTYVGTANGVAVNRWEGNWTVVPV
jgi:hypothetical protein